MDLTADNLARVRDALAVHVDRGATARILTGPGDDGPLHRITSRPANIDGLRYESDPIGATRTAIQELARSMREQEEARAKAARDSLDRYRDAWRSANGRPVAVAVPGRRDQSQRAKWLRRRAKDEGARDLHDMVMSLVMRFDPIELMRVHDPSSDEIRFRASQRVGFSVLSPSGGLLHITGA